MRNGIHRPYEYRHWCDTVLGIVFRSFCGKHRRATYSACTASMSLVGGVSAELGRKVPPVESCLAAY